MSKVSTPAEFQQQARAQVEKQESAIASNLESIGSIEKRLIEISSSPTQETIAEGLKLKGELLARRSIIEDFTRYFRADSEYTKLLSTQAGADVLKGFVEEKKRIIAALKAQIQPLRKKAMELESDGKDEESFSKNEEADNLAATVAAYEVHLQHATAALARFPQQIDSATSFMAIVGHLYQIN